MLIGNVVYTTQTISTIVDGMRAVELGYVYTTQTISTIVDSQSHQQAEHVYTTQTISTIVDFVNYARRINSLQGIVQIILTLLSCFGVKLLNFVWPNFRVLSFGTSKQSISHRSINILKEK